jgi:tetratricopeptide (TPR) repeat protein
MKCTICQTTKGKRVCKIKSGDPICPRCCADIRDEECAECPHYKKSESYQRDKMKSAAKKKEFIARIIPALDDACDKALELVEMGDIKKGQKRLLELSKEHPDYHNVLYGIGVCHCIQGRIQEAIPCFKRAIEIFPLLTEAHYNLGASYFQNADIENAVKSFENVIGLDGEDGEYSAMARQQLDNLDKIARKSHGISLQDYIKNQQVFNRAFDALRRGDFQNAIHLFNHVLRIDESHVQSYGNMGLAYAGIGDKKRAIECFDKALALDPSYEPAAFNRLALEKAEDCKSLFEKTQIHEVDYYRDSWMKESGAKRRMNSMRPSKAPLRKRKEAV